MAATEASSETSTATGMAAARPASALSEEQSFSAPAKLRSATKTRAPEDARPRTISSPKPWAPPVTIAMRPATTSQSWRFRQVHGYHYRRRDTVSVLFFNVARCFLVDMPEGSGRRAAAPGLRFGPLTNHSMS